MEIGFNGCTSPLMGLAKRCAYTGDKFTDELRPTFEHILPKSQKGTWNIDNGLEVTEEVNNARGNRRFDEWLKMYPCVVKNIQKYLDELRGIQVCDIDYVKKDYVEEVVKTLNREARGFVAFRGNKINKIV